MSKVVGTPARSSENVGAGSASFSGEQDLRVECRESSHAAHETTPLTTSVLRCGARTGNQFIMLLVDSEEPVSTSDGPWQHVSKRDSWTRPARAADEGLCLMVQCMEAWFVADSDCLKAYYGQGFNVRTLPRRPEVESIAKADLYTALDRATQNCAKGKYGRGKGRHSFGILATVDPNKVAAASPHARRLLQTLREAAK